MTPEADLIEHLASLEAYLSTSEDPEFLFRLARVLRAVRGHPVGNPLLGEMMAEDEAERRAFTDDDAARVRSLKALRTRLAEIDPTLSPLPPVEPDPEVFTPPARGLAWIDALTEPEESHPSPCKPGTAEDPSLAGRAIKTLQSCVDRLEEERSSPEVDAVARMLGRLNREHHAALTRFQLHGWSSGPASLARIVAFVESIERGDHSPFVNGALFGRERSGDANAALLRTALALRRDATRFFEDARTRARARRSTAWVMHRFKARCEHYDAARLREIAASGGRQPEARLTEELSRFLFDAGLNPLSRPMLGSLQPDVLVGAGARWLFVEAKQYDRRDDSRLRRGAAQLMEYVATARGSGYEIREAYLVIFRRGGPLYDFPNAESLGGVTFHAVLVDVAPATSRGSKARDLPVRLDRLFS